MHVFVTKSLVISFEGKMQKNPGRVHLKYFLDGIQRWILSGLVYVAFFVTWEERKLLFYGTYKEWSNEKKSMLMYLNCLLPFMIMRHVIFCHSKEWNEENTFDWLNWELYEDFSMKCDQKQSLTITSSRSWRWQRGEKMLYTCTVRSMWLISLLLFQSVKLQLHHFTLNSQYQCSFRFPSVLHCPPCTRAHTNTKSRVAVEAQVVGLVAAFLCNSDP